MTVAGGCRRRDVTRGVPTPSSPRGGRQRELGGQPARLGEGSASLPAGMRERARRLGAASRSYRGRGRVWINSCVFAPRERPGRRRDGHAPSASWLLSWIWRCVTLLPPILVRAETREKPGGLVLIRSRWRVAAGAFAGRTFFRECVWMCSQNMPVATDRANKKIESDSAPLWATSAGQGRQGPLALARRPRSARRVVRQRNAWKRGGRLVGTVRTETQDR